ncbi:MAG: hypothetical protein ABF649_21570, partial [Bacillus sp. (in: firmicutes)]
GLIGYLFLHFIWFYIKNKKSEKNNVLTIFWITIFIAFSPFICFYVIPLIIFKQELISAEITAIFLIVIPISFVYLQLVEKLFDIGYLLNRLRYYSILSLPFSIFVTFLIKLLLKMNVMSARTMSIFLLLFIGTTFFLYIKEFIDYKWRHTAFLQKSNFETSLYTFFQRAKDETKVDSLINYLMNLIKDVLKVKQVLYI